MRLDIVELLSCPVCGNHPLSYEYFDMDGEYDIQYGVLWCSACWNWYPIENGLLELLSGDLAYADDRTRFWTDYKTRLEVLGLRPFTTTSNQLDVENKLRQQDHFDWFANNPQQTYTSYEQSSFWQAADTLAFEEWRKEIVPGSCLLDVGCAQGRSTFKIIDLDLRIVGFDISKALIRQAIERYRQKKWRSMATFFVADATHFPFVESCFDYVLIYGVLHHLPDPRATCQEIVRVLRPGGTYFGSENNKTVFRSCFDLLQWLYPLWHEEAGTKPLISKKDFAKWLQKAGMKISVRTSIFCPPHLANQFYPNVAHKILKATDRFFSFIPIIRNQGGLILVSGTKIS
jgi:ubiquinone/menaquinone biosynthesis C-methylase UbiE/uncharacterized protein YbaR (Trm112 family)